MHSQRNWGLGWPPAISEVQVHEAEQQALHNSLVVGKGLLLMKDIIIDECTVASGLRIVDMLEYIVVDIVAVFKGFSEKENRA